MKVEFDYEIVEAVRYELVKRNLVEELIVFVGGEKVFDNIYVYNNKKNYDRASQDYWNQLHHYINKVLLINQNYKKANAELKFKIREIIIDLSINSCRK